MSVIEVLQVEDNPGDVRLTQVALKESLLRINLSVARDGEEAMAFLRQEGIYSSAPRPELVLLDLNMPKKDGWAVLAEMRNDPALTCIPVVVFTTSDAIDDVVRCYELHANAFVSKPLDVYEFTHAMKSIETFWMGVAKLPRDSK